VKPKVTRGAKQRTTPAERFYEQYGVTPRFFVGCCLLPALLAVTRLACFYRGVLVETLETPAWKTRLRALRTVFAMTAAQEIQQEHIKVPLGALRPAQLATIAGALLETDWGRIAPEFLATHLQGALDAMNIAYLFYHGRLVDSLQTQDSGTQMEAAKIAARVHRLCANDRDNIHFATYRDIMLLVSAARQKGKQIQIVRQSQILYIR
jgi:hypothetical protein